MTRNGRPRNVMLLDVDVQGYGSREDHHHAHIQADLLYLLNESANLAGLDRKTWERQLKGDEELSAVPLDGREFRLMDSFLMHLGAATQRLNSGRNDAGRVRLRGALHEGVITPARAGWAGRAVIDTTRLLNSAAVRAALTEEPEVVLAVIVSRSVFDRTVRAGVVAARPEDFRRVEVSEKEFHDEAWLWTYPLARRGGGEAASPSAAPPPQSPRDTPAAVPAHQSITTGSGSTAHQANRDVITIGTINAQDVHFGNRRG